MIQQTGFGVTGMFLHGQSLEDNLIKIFGVIKFCAILRAQRTFHVQTVQPHSSGRSACGNSRLGSGGIMINGSHQRIQGFLISGITGTMIERV